MRFASLRDGSLDGQGVVVRPDGLGEALALGSFRAALESDDYTTTGSAFAFDVKDCLSPLPRAWAFLDGSAYVNHVELVRKARGAELPDSFWSDPLMYQGLSDTFLAPRDPITGDPAWGIDLEAEIAVITGPVRRGATKTEAAKAIRAVMLLNDVSLRNLIPAELAKGFGFVQGKPASSFAPFAVTPEALPGWAEGKLNGILKVDVNGQPFGRADAGQEMTFDFPTLIAHAAKTRDLSAGTIIGSGTVSNRDADGSPGRPVAEGGRGYSCIAEQRMVETILSGKATTPFLQPGDTVKIWMEGPDGSSLFGTIDQEVTL